LRGTGSAQARRTGEILEVLGKPGREHFQVRWEDGRESFFYPGGESSIRPQAISGRTIGDERS